MPLPHAHAAADPAQHPVHRRRGAGRAHGALGHGRADRAPDRRRRRSRRRGGIRLADPGQGRDLGNFFLLDDAFRVGEYIVSGSYKGTVESFSLRSIKLRHHRGYLYTVPFGSLGAVQNMSRDWVIDKLSFNVPFDSDLDKMKKLVKQIGKELMADPELAPDILQPLKMQGVEAMGETGMQVRLKMMTKPGQQFTVRRRAYARLKQLFAENGIKFALPTVQVAEGAAAPAAAAMLSWQDQPTAA